MNTTTRTASGHVALGLLAASGTAFFGTAATGFVTRLAGGGAVDAGLPMAVALLATALAFAWARRTSPVARFHGRAFRYLLDTQVLVLLTALSGPHPGVMATVAVTFVVLRLLTASALSPTTTRRP
ncbi:hypothetical protein [Paractinoplanes rishiriensis]|uniref:Uncharacterized protein n=1 Tax=Paractinoplanes rishiriensis TaxID=1050105 RepID=A0A919MS67_9ACTN|nr:hypothetical protein [Actinoplanes rishiriensis]GIE93323.1 hypothetical protein Ari01nite_07880 [Actinoplanes rishiriensis]